MRYRRGTKRRIFARNAHERAPREIVLDLDNTDIPLRMASRRDGFSTAIIKSTATCRSTCSAVGLTLNLIINMRTRKLQAECFVDEITSIADDGRNDFMRRCRPVRDDAGSPA
jgi:hypothetical protein